MHRVVVLVRGTVRCVAGRLEGALVDVGRDAETEPVGDGVDRPPLALVEREQRLAEGERGLPCRGRPEAGGDRAVGADRDPATLEERLAEGVSSRRPGEGFRDVDRIVGHGLVELGQGRQARRRGRRRHEVVAVEPADRGDPCTVGDVLGPLGVGLLDVFDGVGVLERRVMAGPVPHQDDVVVVVDDPGDDGAPLEVDRLGVPAVAATVPALADGGEPAVLDEHGRDHPVAAVHRVDAAVDEADAFARPSPTPTAVAAAVGGRGGTDTSDGDGCPDDCTTAQYVATSQSVLALLFSHQHAPLPPRSASGP